MAHAGAALGQPAAESQPRQQGGGAPVLGPSLQQPVAVGAAGPAWEKQATALEAQGQLVLVEERLASAWAEGEVEAKLAELRVLKMCAREKTRFIRLASAACS